MFEQFLVLFAGMLGIIGILGSIVAFMVFEKINVYLGVVLLIATVSGFITIIDHQARHIVQIAQGVSKC